MNILGIRVEPKETTFVVIATANDSFSLLNCENIKIPLALDFPDRLKYIRNCILDIMREYSIAVAGIKIAEGNTRNLNITRLHIEGVIQEAFSSSNVEKYFTGRKQSIASKLNIKPKEMDEIIKGDRQFSKLEKFNSLSNRISREAALVGMGAWVS